MKIDIGFCEDLIKEALRRGADQAEVFVRSSKNLSVEIKDQSVDSFSSSSSFGYSLRIIRDRRLGFSYSTDRKDADSVVGKAVEAAGYSDEDEYIDLPEETGKAEVEIYDPAIAELKEEDAVAKVMLLERAAYDEDDRVKKIRSSSGSFTSSAVAVVNSRSISAEYLATSCSAQIMAVAEESGESQMGWYFEGSRFLRDISFESIGKNAAKRALCLLGSRKITGCKAVVILDNSVTTDFLGIFAASISSESVQKGKSLLKGKLHKKVISSKINMLDSGLLPGKLGSRPVDDEGVVVRDKVVIKEGVLKTYLYNTYTAKKDGTASTGNAKRGGSSALPGVGVTNLFIEPASHSDIISKEKIIGSVGKGLYVIEAMGVHTANPITGEFSVGVTGLWIENGVPQYAVKEAVISGSILDFFDSVEAVGDDLKFFGSLGSPSLIISDVDISG
jgi:PmbA protein